MAGAFQTSREVFENPIWKNIVDFRLFFLIYGNAIYAEEGYKQSEDLFLQRGEWCRSIRKLQSDLEYIENRQIKTYSVSVISRCIKRLEQSQRIRTRIHELGTVFTVVNYEQYQGFESYRKHNLEHNLEQSGNSGGTAAEQSGNNNKKVNKDNKVKKESIKTYTPEFDEFWNVYPRKLGKVEAFKTWTKVIKNGETPELIIKCATNYATDCENKQTEQQYIKHPKTFLNDERYKDYTLIAVGGGNSGKYGAGYAGPSEASRKAASRGAENFIGSPGRESGLTTEEVQRRASNFD
ncbi:hypothetical protein [Paenibacillus jilunlii]|uniref:hypothetical protein n=1 Tax=Paenibacillus jilunlii TaxID=682956 RepID=UPI000781E538|nr:hypothetical protein [Paenibacillus jilunlii]